MILNNVNSIILLVVIWKTVKIKRTILFHHKRNRLNNDFNYAIAKTNNLLSIVIKINHFTIKCVVLFLTFSIHTKE